ncbi:protein abnormal spindle [Bradysia coprophila]|uniref:protein abnormal spindle n=1 Tax=Bradysia coprophila TaxID=38358 RepID=UPI00187D9004|nr:protein abnormal spindle [Bradysia coprophila]
MSAFEVVVTPTRVKNARRKNAAREPTAVVLAPFSAKSVVTFEDIPVTKTARRFLNITNPCDDDLEITLKSSIDTSFGVTFEWTTSRVPANGCTTMEIVWTPKVEVKTKDTITIVDDRHFKKDVALIFKSIDSSTTNAKPTKPSASTKTAKIVTGKLKIKSPSPPHGLLRQAIQSNKHKAKVSVKDSTAVTGSKATPLHAAGQLPLSELNVFGHHNKLQPNHGKENRSPPRSPTFSATTLFDDIQFTPVNRKSDKPADVDDIEYMASLPTPVTKPTYNSTYAVRNPSDTMEITSFEPNIASTVDRITNSLEPKQLLAEADPRRKLFDMTQSICVENGTLPTSTAPIFNVTHTIVPASSLSNIKEEADESISMQNTFQLPTKLPAVPTNDNSVMDRSSQHGMDTLHKKFQSMRNLDDISNKQKLLRDNLGSMPNLTDDLEVHAIENNRYFYQNVENGFQANAKRNQSSASSVFGCSVMSFKEQDFLAQSSRFDLDKSHGMMGDVSRREFAVPQPVDNYAMKRTVDNEHHKRKPAPKWSPPKRSKLDSTSNSSICSSSQSISRRTSNWGGVKPKKFPYAIPKLNLIRQKPEEERVVFFDAETHFKSVINPDVFAATTTNDPFLCVSMYLDEECIEKHEINFKKWLNALVAIPWEIDSDKQQQVDFGKLFNDVRGKDVNTAETKEQVSSHYLTKHRMESLRKTATTLYMSDKMTAMLQKLCVLIERGQLKMRDGLELHLDIVLQREILQLLLNFNPLWLRISLEVIYGEIINMSHNFDIMSLSRFIVNRLFRNKHLEQKVSKYSSQKTDPLKKFTLKKLFMLLIYLDNAKQNKIITYNPCLFVKSSPFKETKEILCRFSSLILGNMGDIQRDLKRIGIVLSHKQTYIEEFDYAFRNLAVDLRDGIRLTKVMEIILLRDDMVNQLRVPAISRLQKVYNVDLALNALRSADFTISGGIVAADIADGHREKTLSLLWQIIYKFRAPKFIEAAISIQLWWRRSWLRVVIKQRIRAKLLKAKISAATRIQAAYRGHLSRKWTKMWHAKRTSAAIILQSHIRRYLAQKHFKRQSTAAKYIEHWYQRTCLYNRQRNHYLHQRNSIIIIQQWYRRVRLAKKIESLVPVIISLRKEAALQNRCAMILQTRYRATCLMRLERRNYLKMRSSAIVIQQRFRSFLLMKQDRTEYQRVRSVIVTIQRKFRANLQSKQMRSGFQSKKQAALCIQKYFRATVEARRVRTEYLTFKQAAQTLQIRYRARLEMLKAVNEYQTMKRSAIVVQQRYRARLKMLEESKMFQIKRKAVIVIQTRYRSIVEMRQQRDEYLRTKLAAQQIQLRWRATLLMRKQRADYVEIRKATVSIQRRVIANREMLKQRTNFVALKKAAISIQTRYRSLQMMREDQSRYQQLLWACRFVQQRFRANKIANIQQAEYQHLKNHVIRVQSRFRANQLMKSERKAYLQLKETVIRIQTMFRAKLEMRSERQHYLHLIKMTVFVQRMYRAKKAMETDLAHFKHLKWSATVIQDRYRAQMQMKRQRIEYLEQKSSAITIQRWIRSVKLLRHDRQQYLSYRQSVINVQLRYRAKLQAQEDRSNYKLLQWATLYVQRLYRAKCVMRQQQIEFQRTRNAAIVIQRRYRAKIESKKQITEYRTIVRSVKLIQTRFREYKLAKMERERFFTIRCATIKIQQYVRSYRLTQIVRKDFLELKESTIFVQRMYRANKLMRTENAHYVKLRNAVTTIQTIHRANILMRRQREIYQEKRLAALTIQNYYRATQLMKAERCKYSILRNSVVYCQRQFRANLMMLQQRCSFLIYKAKVLLVQRQYRATLQMRSERAAFEQLKKSTVFIQRRFRSNILAKNQRSEYLRLIQATVFIQQKYRANKAMQMQRKLFLRQKTSCLVLQHHFRAILAGRMQRAQYLRIRSAALVIQQRFVAFKLMREQRAHYQHMRNAAIIIQTRYRGYLVMNENRVAYKQLRSAVVRVQTQYRANVLMRTQRTEFNTLKRSTIVIQRWFRATMRMKVLSNQYKLIRCLVVCIQQRFRAKMAMKMDRKHFTELRAATIVIQQKYRARQRMIVDRNAWHKTRSTVVGLQANIRGFLARRELQKKLTPEFKLFVRQSKCAVKIQAFWRGWNVRKRKMTNAVALKKIREKVQKISKDVRADKRIKHVVFNNIDVLKKKGGRGNTVEILNVLLHLAKISRMVPHLLVGDSYFVVTFCYGIMSQAIRSELDKLIIEQCSFIILNLARYELTKANVFQLRGLTTIAQMLLRWCDKDCDIFNTLCSLVYVFCQSAELTKEIRKFMTSYDAELFTLHQIKRLVKRKDNMRQNKTQLSSTPSRLNARQRSQLPMLKPDFGMNSTKPYIFESSAFAFDTILKKLDITNI